MKFTESKDGLPRATVRIRFRVGVDVLHVAAAELVWARLVDAREDTADAAVEYAAALTRAQIVGKARDVLQANGYGLDAISDDDYWQTAHDATRPVVEKFWGPESAAWAAHASSAGS